MSEEARSVPPMTAPVEDIERLLAEEQQADFVRRFGEALKTAYRRFGGIARIGRQTNGATVIRNVAILEAVELLKPTFARIRTLEAENAALREALEGVLPYVEAERLAELARSRTDRTARMPIRQAVARARAALTLNRSNDDVG